MKSSKTHHDIVEGMETLADPDLESPRVTATRSKSKITVPKRPKVTNPGPVPKGKKLKVTTGKPNTTNMTCVNG